MTTSTTTPHPAPAALPPDTAVRVPMGAIIAEEWQPDSDRDDYYRTLEGQEHHVDDSIRVWARCTQRSDGSIDDGETDPLFGPPVISVAGVS